jgi:hypothetical protein
MSNDNTSKAFSSTVSTSTVKIKWHFVKRQKVEWQTVKRSQKHVRLCMCHKHTFSNHCLLVILTCDVLSKVRTSMAKCLKISKYLRLCMSHAHNLKSLPISHICYWCFIKSHNIERLSKGVKNMWLSACVTHTISNHCLLVISTCDVLSKVRTSTTKWQKISKYLRLCKSLAHTNLHFYQLDSLTCDILSKVTTHRESSACSTQSHIISH